MSSQALRPTLFCFARLGDTIMSTALTALLHRRYGLPCHVVGVGDWTPSVHAGNRDVEHVWSFGRHRPFPLDPRWPSLVRALRASAPGPVYVCEHHPKQLPRIRRMLHLAGVDEARCVFVDGSVEQGRRHAIDRMLELGRSTPSALDPQAWPVPQGSFLPRLQLTDRERMGRDAWLAAQGWRGQPLILVQAGNHRSMSRRRRRWERRRTDDKAWPVERWARLLRIVHADVPDARILLRGSAEELPLLERIRAACAVPAVSAVALGLRASFALCERAHAMIAVDTGLAHAAAALGLPVVVLFGAAPQPLWRPRSGGDSAVIGVGGPPLSMRVDALVVDDVVAAWRELLAGLQDSPAAPLTGAAARVMAPLAV